MKTATSTPQTKDLIGWTRKNDRAAQAFWCNFPTYSTERRRGIFTFEILTTTRVSSSKSFILRLYVITIRAKQAKAHLDYFQRSQHGIIGHFRVHLRLHFKARLSAKSLLWKSVFIHIEIASNNHNKNFALRLALKKRLRRTRKWPITKD